MYLSMGDIERVFNMEVIQRNMNIEAEVMVHSMINAKAEGESIYTMEPEKIIAILVDERLGQYIPESFYELFDIKYESLDPSDPFYWDEFHDILSYVNEEMGDLIPTPEGFDVMIEIAENSGDLCLIMYMRPELKSHLEQGRKYKDFQEYRMLGFN
jgi:hypothetical protein